MIGITGSLERGGEDLVLATFSKALMKMRREMESEFEHRFRDIETKAPKDLVREYETPEGSKVREYGPFVYGYSMTIGPDGKPKVREFGNVKSPLSPTGRKSIFTGSMISSEREPLADITSTNTEIKVIVELPGVNKENIKVMCTTILLRSSLLGPIENITKSLKYLQKQILKRPSQCIRMVYSK